MTTLLEATAETSTAMRIAGRVSRGLARFSRRGFLVQTAVVGSALVVDPKGYVLRPQTAAATVCGPGAACADGYTVFCCTINRGHNSCPPGTFAAGWWKAADSSWCGGGYRYIVDCNASCSDCSTGCSDDNICNSSCWSCNCRCSTSSGCDKRKVCCNAFRYGQCNTQVRCSGGVACRVVSCVAPYNWTNCTTTSLTDNATAEHSAVCLPRPGAIQRKYDQLGSNGGALGASTNAIREVGDGRGQYLTCENGQIYSAPSPGAHAIMTGWALTRWLTRGGTTGVLRYPTDEVGPAMDGKGLVQTFEGGAIAITPGRTKVGAVWSTAYSVWVGLGREGGVLGYPSSDRTYPASPTAWIQPFGAGAICGTSHGTFAVHGAIWQRWTALSGPSSVIGWPVQAQVGGPGGGVGQTFQSGQLWARSGNTAYVVRSRVLAAWQADGGVSGSWGYPLGDTEVESGGGQHQVFEGGVLSA
ncbi:hypothetical protein ACPPVT_19070 [Angustibacter sp. McL0619]|uniref:hypothetical protein n=1 Tax=Angustibacter sp. McL0619 TaxID=3415676 RepID=UPI003CE80EF0